MTPESSALESKLRAKLESLHPTRLVIEDESALHAGHPGAGSGSHCHILICAEVFRAIPILARHQLVYNTLGPLAELGIHALRLTTRAE